MEGSDLQYLQPTLPKGSISNFPVAGATAHPQKSCEVIPHGARAAQGTYTTLGTMFCSIMDYWWLMACQFILICGNSGHEVGIHPGWNSSPSRGTMHTPRANFTTATRQTGMFLRERRKLKILVEPTQEEYEQKTHTDSNWSSGSHQRS